MTTNLYTQADMSTPRATSNYASFFRSERIVGPYNHRAKKKQVVHVDELGEYNSGNSSICGGTGALLAVDVNLERSHENDQGYYI